MRAAKIHFMMNKIQNWFVALLLLASLLAGASLLAQNQEAVANPQSESNTNLQAEQPDQNAPGARRKRLSPADWDSDWRASGAHHRQEIVRFHQDVELKAGDTADTVVVIGGSAKVDGKVGDTVTTIAGDAEVNGDVHNVVAVMGSIKLGKTANVHDVVAVGGKVEVEEGATVTGEIHEIDPVALGLPAPKWLQNWFFSCVLMVRPLSLHVGFVWIVAAVFVLIYILIAAAFPRPVLVCVNEVSGRPATTFFLGLLTLVLLPLAFIILAATGVGLLIWPFLIAAVFFAAVVGKVAILETLGLKLGAMFGPGIALRPLGALLLGVLIITLFYLIPFIGFLTFCLVSVWGLGAASAAAFSGMRKEMPSKFPTPPPPDAFPPTPTAPITPTAPASGPEPSSAAFAAPSTPVPTISSTVPASEPPPTPFAQTGPAPAAQPTPISTLTPQPSPGPAPFVPAPTALPDILAYPKASFWERMGAGFLDIVLAAILGGIAGSNTFPLIGFLAVLVYFAGLWTWKGTTIGGIVIGLKVIRTDSGPVTLTVAIVRALAAAFSIIMFFLGFLWIIWDKEKQAWHDKIAGTVVLRLPKGTPLVCL
jgi:uncharacterized RDD family membrane protein YckC